LQLGVRCEGERVRRWQSFLVLFFKKELLPSIPARQPINSKDQQGRGKRDGGAACFANRNERP